ncbi:actinodefensin-associated protein B [Streptomyces sp. NPDC057002]|uniref:actinodefensin-associated protein B n=1 Tax=Streptomyces sp. NPDC057002 TaxID=3345992 RepID=UPI00362A35EE
MPTSRALPRLAPHVRFTPLPFGGAVLVRASTLSIAECGEQEARVVERLLSHGLPGPGTGPAGEAVRRMSRELVAAGWLEAPTAPHVSAVPGADPTAVTPAEDAAPDIDRR